MLFVWLQTDKKYEVVKDQRSQLKFLEELDQLEKKRQDEVEREVLLRAAKVGDNRVCYVGLQRWVIIEYITWDCKGWW